MAVPGAKISLALGGAKKLSKPAPTNGVKRSHAALRDDDDDVPDEGKAQIVSHFDKSAGGAIDEANRKRETGPLVIAPQANRDWKDSSKRRKQRHGLPAEAQQNVVTEEAIKELEANKPAFGLNVTKRDNDDGEPIINGHDVQAEAEATQQQAPEPNGEASVKIKTDDELAMDALLGKTTKQDLVLPAMNEEQAFEQDFRTAPDMASLDDYVRVPVEQFGAALLRGMGWKDGEGIGLNRGRKVEKTKVPERRPALLGIGAKEEAAVAQEMGVWGKAAKKGGEVKVYNPVLLRDKKTGQLFTEDELQKKRERDEREKYEAEFERKERDQEGRRRRDDGDDKKGKDRGKEYRRDSDRDDKKDRRRHDDSDEEYYRRKEKERRRRERDREDEDYDRERSRKHDSGRDKHRSRHDDRDRRR
ncbi:hypothetical protein LTR36_002203 [Oleoguttula mirabilis]|uniref:Pre-mRNA-splicing factor n=1 Tax=Oleoguttula mirabilis TaxID=1507867 RepID=A0AAV9JL45_9PEZI|nr:hypothetical protein LTR36_002203 [Oleoguttula mirabilis]